MENHKNNITSSLEKYSYNNTSKRSNIKIFLIIAAIVLIAGYFWNKSGSDKQQAPQSPPVNVTVNSVQKQDMPNIINLVGTVYAYETVTLKSRIDSQIVGVYFKDGDFVKEGSVLFKLDDSVLKADLNQFEANLKRDEAQLENARTQYARYQNLAKRGYASKEKMEDASASFKTQQAAFNATKASLDSARAMLTYTVIKAPISGRAGTINVTRGNNVKANDTTPLVTINQVTPIRVQFAIPQRYYDALRATSNGIEVTATRAEGQNIAVGKLEYIDNNIDAATGTFIARAAFENADEKLWPGMFANISITLNVDRDALTIPQVAVQNGSNGTFVYMVDSEGKKAIKHNVEVLRMQDNKAIIKSGLNEGDNVVVDGLLKISDGATIAVSNPEQGTKTVDGDAK